MTCQKYSTQVFAHAWMCLEADCTSFWKDTNGNTAADSELVYNEDFIEQRSQWPKNVRPTYALRPELPSSDPESASAEGYSRNNWKGIVCPRCGRCICRRHWDAWKCTTLGCGFVHDMHQPVLSSYSVLQDHEAEFDGHAPPVDKVFSGITSRPVEHMGDWLVSTYELLPGNIITHFQANKSINRASYGTDTLFAALQKNNAMGLQRFPMKQKIGKSINHQ